jgi:hypothetical protein
MNHLLILGVSVNNSLNVPQALSALAARLDVSGLGFGENPIVEQRQLLI